MTSLASVATTTTAAAKDPAKRETHWTQKAKDEFHATSLAMYQAQVAQDKINAQHKTVLAKEQALLDELQNRKDALNAQKEAQRAQLMHKANAVSAEDAKTLVENFDVEYSRIERRIESQKAHSSNAVKQKLAARRTARQKRLKVEQRSERLRADLETRQKQAATENEEIKKQEASKIDNIKPQETSNATTHGSTRHEPTDAADKGEAAATSEGQEPSTNILIASILEERHGKEISEQEGQKDALENLAMDRAELPINAMNDQAVQDLVLRQELESADLFNKMRNSNEAQTDIAHDALMKSHERELGLINAKFESQRQDVCSAASTLPVCVRVRGVGG